MRRQRVSHHLHQVLWFRRSPHSASACLLSSILRRSVLVRILSLAATVGKDFKLDEVLTRGKSSLLSASCMRSGTTSSCDTHWTTRILLSLAWRKVGRVSLFLAHICRLAYSVRAYTPMQVSVCISPFALSLTMRIVMHSYMDGVTETTSKTYYVFARSMVNRSYPVIDLNTLSAEKSKLRTIPQSGLCLFWFGKPASASMWEIGPYFWSQSWIILAVLSGEKLRSPWKVAGQLWNSILISRTSFKPHRIERLCVLLLAFFSQFWYLCIVYRRLYFREEQPNQHDPTHPLNCSLSASLLSTASTLLHSTSCYNNRRNHCQACRSLWRRPWRWAALGSWTYPHPQRQVLHTSR